MVEERRRVESGVRALGLEPLPSWTNFLFVPVDDAPALSRRRCSARASSCAPSRRASASTSATRRTTTCCSTRSRARSTGRRRSPRRAAAGRAACARRPRRASACGSRSTAPAACAWRPARASPTTCSSSSPSTPGFDLVLEGAGDLETGDHHTAEDAAIALGEALDLALGDRRGIARYGDAVVPMDDALARAAVDLGGRPWAEVSLEREPGMAAHMLGSLAQAGRLAIHVEATGRDDHHCRRGRVQGGRPRAAQGRCGRGRPRAAVDEGARVTRVAVCDYGAGNVRSVAIALERLGAEVTVTTDAETVAGPTWPCCRASAPPPARWRPCARPASTRRSRARTGPTLGICLGLQLALERLEEDGGVDGPRAPPRPRASACARAACRGSAGRRSTRAATRTTSPTRSPRRRRAATAWSEGCVAEARAGAFLGVQFHPEKSGAAGARCTWSDASPPPDPLPRRRGRPRRQGRPLPGAARRRRPGRARRARTPTPAPTSSSSSTSRRRSRSAARCIELVARVAERLAIPFTVGGGVRSAADAEALLRAGADKVAVNSAALERPALIAELAERLGSQAVVVAIDATRGRVHARAGTTDDRRATRSSGRARRGARRRRDPAHLDRRRRHARRLRPRADRARSREPCPSR